MKNIRYSLLSLQKIEREKKSYKTGTDNQRVLKIGKMINFILEGKIASFKLIVIFKIGKIIFNWKKHLPMITGILLLCILSQYMWYNDSIQVDKVSVHFLQFSEKNINYDSQLFSENGSIKKWHELHVINY